MFYFEISFLHKSILDYSPNWIFNTILSNNTKKITYIDSVIIFINSPVHIHSIVHDTGAIINLTNVPSLRPPSHSLCIDLLFHLITS